MGEIEKLPPAYRIPPTRAPVGSGNGKQAPQRKPATDNREPDQRRRRQPDDEDPAHVDEYA